MSGMALDECRPKTDSVESESFTTSSTEASHSGVVEGVAKTRHEHENHVLAISVYLLVTLLLVLIFTTGGDCGGNFIDKTDFCMIGLEWTTWPDYLTRWGFFLPRLSWP